MECSYKIKSNICSVVCFAVVCNSIITIINNNYFPKGFVKNGTEEWIRSFTSIMKKIIRTGLNGLFLQLLLWVSSFQNSLQNTD
uniref:Uncharacterized protein n=1 Tax=Octopus bimaculoides TaxID=37653 RepID=A0A0L8G6W7_OCTBM